MQMPMIPLIPILSAMQKANSINKEKQCVCIASFLLGDNVNYKSKYLSSAFLLLLTSVIVKIIGAFYKIPLTSFIGAVGRGYFAAAYNLYMPIHAVIMGAFPIALSRITGKYNAKNNQKALGSLKTGANKLFFKIGVIGTALMLLLSKPYCDLIASSPKSIYSVFALAPSVFFSALASSYRGYYEGFMNMRPTSFSQTIEALFKLVFGLIFARLAMRQLYNSYITTGFVLGRQALSEEEALSLIYPITSACAMLGVTLGCFVSYIYVFIYHQINKPECCAKRYGNSSEYESELLKFSYPIMISCAIQSIFQFLDTASVQGALSLISKEDLTNAYSQSIAVSNTSADDIITYVYGILSSAADFKNLIPGITMALGVCAVPAISSAFESKNQEQMNTLINSLYKYTSVISAAGGILIAINSKDILMLFYQSSAPDIVISCNELIKYFALSVPVYSLAGASVFCVQAIGVPKKTVAPYVFSGIIRVILNILLVSNENYILFGSVISGAAGYLLMFALNTKTVKKEVKVRISVKNSYIKPMLVGIITCISGKYLVTGINISTNLLINLLIKLAVLSLIYCILCILFKLLSFKEIFCMFKSKKMA